MVSSENGLDRTGPVMLQKLVVRPVETELAFVQKNDRIAQAQIARRMGDQDDGFVQAMRQFFQPDHHLVLGIGIETGGHFVEKEKSGIPHQFLRHGDAPHLAARKRPVFLVEKGADAGQVDDVLAPLIAGRPGHGTGQAQRHGEIEDFRHGQVLVERPHFGQIADGERQLVPQRFHGMPRQQDAPLGDRLNAGQRSDQDAFARAGLANDGEKRSLRDGDGNIAKDRLAIVTAAHHHRQVPDKDSPFHFGRRIHVEPTSRASLIRLRRGR